MPKEQKYGWVSGPKPNRHIELADSQEIRAKSGRFITIAGGIASIAVAASVRLEGFLEDGDRSTGTGQNLRVTRILPNLADKFQIPVEGGTFDRSMIGKSCDLIVASDIQGANLAASVTDVLLIVDGDIDDNDWVIVQYNPEKLEGFVGVV